MLKFLIFLSENAMVHEARVKHVGIEWWIWVIVEKHESSIRFFSDINLI
jgi:hypothetical protein